MLIEIIQEEMLTKS